MTVRLPVSVPERTFGHIYDFTPAQYSFTEIPTFLYLSVV